MEARDPPASPSPSSSTHAFRKERERRWSQDSDAPGFGSVDGSARARHLVRAFLRPSTCTPPTKGRVVRRVRGADARTFVGMSRTTCGMGPSGNRTEPTHHGDGGSMANAKRRSNAGKGKGLVRDRVVNSWGNVGWTWKSSSTHDLDRPPTTRAKEGARTWRHGSPTDAIGGSKETRSAVAGPGSCEQSADDPGPRVQKKRDHCSHSHRL